MKPKVQVGCLKRKRRIDVEAAVSLAIHQENRSLAGKGAKGTFLPMRANAHRVLEELRLLVFLSLVQAAWLPIRR